MTWKDDCDLMSDEKVITEQDELCNLTFIETKMYM